MDTIEVGGLDVAFQQQGTGPPLLLLHGILQDSRAWRAQLDALSDEFMVVAWDAPGCGRSSDPPETFALRDYADRLAAFVDALGLGQPHVLGLSFGAVLALELCRRHPLVPRSLVLASAYAGWAGSLPPEVVEARLAQALREAGLPADQFVPGWIPGLLTESAPAELVDAVVAMMSEFHPAGYRAMAHALASAFAWGRTRSQGVVLSTKREVEREKGLEPSTFCLGTRPSRSAPRIVSALQKAIGR